MYQSSTITPEHHVHKLMTKQLDQTWMIVGMGQNPLHEKSKFERIPKISKGLPDEVDSVLARQGAYAERLTKMRKGIIGDSLKPLHIVKPGKDKLEAPICLGHQVPDQRNLSESAFLVFVQE